MTLDGKKALQNGFGTHGYEDESIDGILNGTHDEHEDNVAGGPRPGSSSRANHSLNGAFVDRTASHAHPNGADVTIS